MTVLVTLRIPGAFTLKEKRSVVRSAVERLRTRRGLAAAEVGRQDQPGAAVIGFAAVSGSMANARDAAEEALRWLDGELLGRAEIVATAIEESVIEEEDAGPAGWQPAG